MEEHTARPSAASRATPSLPELLGPLLHFGYLVPPTIAVASCAWHVQDGARLRSTISPNEKDLVEQGSTVLCRIFEKVDHAHHIVPLSGGLDSRAILGGLIHAGMKDSITAVTFGVPGTLDYELGHIVAQELGVRHVAINLDEIEVTTPALIDMVLREGLNCWLFDCYYNRLIPTMFGVDARYWSGFMGDPLAGSHLARTESREWWTAMLRFLERNRFAGQVRLAHPETHLEAYLPREPFLPREWLTYDEQIDFAVRQEGYIRRVVTVEGYSYETPFLDREWATFILSVPVPLRREERLYSRILQHAFPEAFSLPTKRTYGLALGDPAWRIQWRRYATGLRRRLAPRLPFLSARTDPVQNYINFAEAIRRRKDFRTLVCENISDLRRRDLLTWLDLDHLVDEHLRGRCDYSRELTLLTSLEVLLKARESSSLAQGV